VFMLLNDNKIAPSVRVVNVVQLKSLTDYGHSARLPASDKPTL
jgi:hypothetical protein